MLVGSPCGVETGRVSALTHDPADEVAHLRASLLKGRGPGASEREIAANTRDRPSCDVIAISRTRDSGPLALNPTCTGAAVGSPDAAPRPRPSDRLGRQGAAVLGAAAALLVQSIGIRLVRNRRPEQPLRTAFADRRQEGAR